jgi:hypothetical protein
MLTRTPFPEGARPALALHLRVFPVEIQIERAAHARPKVTVAGREAAGFLGGTRWRSRSGRSLRLRNAEATKAAAQTAMQAR